MLTEAEIHRLLRMEEALHAWVVGLDEPVKTVSRAIRRSRCPDSVAPLLGTPDGFADQMPVRVRVPPPALLAAPASEEQSARCCGRRRAFGRWLE